MRLCKLLALTVLFTLCFAPTTGSAEQAENSPWKFEDYAQKLRETSCPSQTVVFPFSTLDIDITAVELGASADVRKALPSEVAFVGGWHLTAIDADFGGLSGLDMMEDGDLLAVSDAGAFFTIGLTRGVPDGRGRKGQMLGADGKALIGKSLSDAEGLAYREGLAFVSFERDNRVLAFDIKGCEGVARGVLVSQLPDVLGGQSIKPNSGPEALSFNSNGNLVAGYETVIDGYSWLLTLGTEGEVFGAPTYLKTPDMFKLVGSSEGAFLTRAYDPIMGNRNQIEIIDQDLKFRLAPPLNVDNFEGISLNETQNGLRRLYIISDDNFSGRQRTLLYAFDIVVNLE